MGAVDVRDRMDRMYGLQRFVYDPTRKFYLIGRDRLLRRLAPSAGAEVIEIGCGTARNLILLADLYPTIRLHGIDASAAMLTTARGQIERAGHADRIAVHHGLAEEADAAALGLPRGFDHVILSYALSIIDHPIPALERAVSLLAPGGRLHVVDFGPQAATPALLRRLRDLWLERFGVHHRPEVQAWLDRAEARGGGRLEVEDIGGGYAQILQLTTPMTTANR